MRVAPSGQVVISGYGVDATGRHTGYTAPEVARGDAATVLSDQWSMGAIAVELLLGERLYDSSEDRRARCREGEVGPWLAQIGRAWPALVKTIGRLLDPDPAKRFDDPAAMQEALAHALESMPGAPGIENLVSRIRAVENRLSARRPPRPEVLPQKLDEPDTIRVAPQRVRSAPAARAPRAPDAARPPATPVAIAPLEAPAPASPPPPKAIPASPPRAEASAEPVDAPSPDGFGPNDAHTSPLFDLSEFDVTAGLRKAAEPPPPLPPAEPTPPPRTAPPTDAAASASDQTRSDGAKTPAPGRYALGRRSKAPQPPSQAAQAQRAAAQALRRNAKIQRGAVEHLGLAA